MCHLTHVKVDGPYTIWCFCLFVMKHNFDVENLGFMIYECGWRSKVWSQQNVELDLSLYEFLEAMPMLP